MQGEVSVFNIDLLISQKKAFYLNDSSVDRTDGVPYH